MARVRNLDSAKSFGTKNGRPRGLSDSAWGFFQELKAEADEQGIDTRKYRRALVQLAKDFAMEEICEKEVNELGRVCYAPESSSILKDHPAAKQLHTIRNRIYILMKAMGMMPNSNISSSLDKSESSFAAFG